MKATIITAFVVLLLLLAGCTDKESSLTQVNMQDLKVPQGFTYEMKNKIDIEIDGSWRLPVVIKSTGGELLFKAQLNPETGLKTQLVLPKTIKKVVVEYQMYSEEISVQAGTLKRDFRVR
ncbi:MAG: hypothetical protein PHC50_06505 [Candidatus Cloacimonetes bacterium]|nr:hypothetical protein [Candidatus Cloacimonadota bacterium]